MSFYKRALEYRMKQLSGQPEKLQNGLLRKAILYRDLKRKGKSSSFGAVLKSEPISVSSISLSPELKDVTSKYFSIIDNISGDMSSLQLTERAYERFTDIISDNFDFSKSALLVYSPQEQRFTCWYGKDISRASADKLSFDVEYNEIYKHMIKEKYFMILQEEINYMKLQEILSPKDFNESAFQLYIPFIFSGRVIGIFMGLRIKEKKIPDKELINSLIIIGRLNGPLLYNIFQQEHVTRSKKKQK